MLLATALLRSMHGIATRSRICGKTAKGPKYEFYFAAVSDKRKVHILYGRVGYIRDMTAEDQSRQDWEPFGEVPDVRRRIPAQGSRRKPVKID